MDIAITIKIQNLKGNIKKTISEIHPGMMVKTFEHLILWYLIKNFQETGCHKPFCHAYARGKSVKSS